MDNILAAAVAYAAFALLALVGPGIALQRLARCPVDPALVLPLGLVVTAATFWSGLVLGWPILFPAVVGVLDLSLLLPGVPWTHARGPSLRGSLPAAVGLVALLALTQYRWNRVGPSGEFLLDPFVPYDTAFHVGLVHELTLGYPPQVPGVSGLPLGYHLGIDLVRAAARQWAHVDPYDSICRFDVTLLAVALLLVVRAAAHALGGSPRAVALAGWTLFATDFSFAFAGSPQAHWWADLLRGNLLVSLALSNPVVPALALALGALVALSRFAADERRGELVLALVLAAAAPFFKVFVGAHLAAGLAVAALLVPARRAACATAALVAAGATACLVLGQGGETVSVTLAPLDLVRTTRLSLGLPPLTGVALFAWAAAWVVLSLGVRVFGLPQAVRALRASAPIGPALATFALVAWPLGLIFRVSAPEVLEGQKLVNDAAYFVEQGGPVLWIFTALALAPRLRGWVLTAAAVTFTLPSTIQFVVKKSATPPDPMPAPMVRAMRALAAASRPGDVVLQRPGARYPPAPVILIGRRVPYERFTPWLTQFAPASTLEARHLEVYRFFRTTDRAEAVAVARRLGARYVCLYGPDRLRFDTSGLLETIHDEPGASCARLRLD